MSVLQKAMHILVARPQDTGGKADVYSKSDEFGSTTSSNSSIIAEGAKAEIKTPLMQDFRHNLKDPTPWTWKRPNLSIRFVAVTVASAIIFILITVLSYYVHHFRSLVPRNSLQEILHIWNNSESPTSNLSHYPTGFSSEITPIPCHSHNDYQHHVPLYEALSAGCRSVEADVWLLGSGDELHVGHSRNSLTAARTLRNLYLDPLSQILTRQNQAPIVSGDKSLAPAGKHGVFDVSPSTALTLLIDIKSNGTATFPILQAHLEPLRSRGWLTRYNGSAVVPGLITVVATGNAPFLLLTKNTTYRDIFYDAPLDALSDEGDPANSTLYNAKNSYYASVAFSSAIGKPWLGTLTTDQVWKIRRQIKQATDRGLKSRYWDTPSWPIGVRDHIWNVLEMEGVGILNVDDLESASKKKW